MIPAYLHPGAISSQDVGKAGERVTAVNPRDGVFPPQRNTLIIVENLERK